MKNIFKNKLNIAFLVILLGFLSFGIGSINFGYNIVKNGIKIKADSLNSGSGSASGSISCSSTTLNYGESTTCNLVVSTTVETNAINGKITSSNNLSISNISKDSGWNGNIENDGTVNLYGDPISAGNLNIASFTVTATAIGNGSVNFEKDEDVKPYVSDSNYEAVYFEPVIQSISVPAPKSNVSTLSSLTLTNVVLNPTFSEEQYNYTATVGNDITSTTVNVVPNDSKATVTGTGEKTLNVGENTITIKVTAEDSSSTTYTVKVNRAEAQTQPVDPTPVTSSDASLKSINLGLAKLTSEFKPSVTSYIANVDENVSEIEISAITNSDKAKVTGTGKVSLNADNTKVTLTVTAEDGTKKEYMISIIKKSKDSNSSEDKTSKVTEENCDYKLYSKVYKIDNDNLTINNVSTSHNSNEIISNITHTCGTIAIDGNKLLYTYNNNVKTYKINKIWLPQTGNDIVKYSFIIGTILIVIGLAMFALVKTKNKDGKIDLLDSLNKKNDKIINK